MTETNWRFMTFEQWRAESPECEQRKEGTQGATWCVVEGIKGYCDYWTPEFRGRCRAFFGNVCVECGTLQNGRKFHVHHVNYDTRTCCKEGEAISDRKFVLLCTKCHAKTRTKRKYWTNYFTEIINEYYGGKCYFTKEEMAALKQ